MRHSPTRRPALGIECLEAREVPAGLVTATLLNGTLTLTGDAANNQVRVQTTAVGDIVVSGINGTRINGGSSYLVPMGDMRPATHLVVNLGDGNDGILARRMQGTDIYMQGGAGHDSIFLRDSWLIGTPVLDGGAGNDRIVVANARTNITGGFWLLGKDGNDTIVVRHASGGLIAVGEAGNDRISLNDLDVFGGLTVDAGSGNDAITFRDTHADGSGTMQVVAAEGNDAITVLNSTAYWMFIGGESGNDRVALGNNAVTFLYVEERGFGDDSIKLRDTRAYDLNVRAGEGNDMISQHNIRATSFQTDGGAGNDRIFQFNTTGRDSTRADSVNVLGGAGDDVIVLRNIQANFPAVYGGEGNDAVYVSGVCADHLLLEGGLGNNRLFMDHITRNTEKITNFQNIP